MSDADRDIKAALDAARAVAEMRASCEPTRPGDVDEALALAAEAIDSHSADVDARACAALAHLPRTPSMLALRRAIAHRADGAASLLGVVRCELSGDAAASC